MRLPVRPAAIPVDAGDAVAVYRVAHESIEKARRGAGPSLIECVGSRDEKNGGALRRLENAIQRIEDYLRKKDLWPVKPDSSAAQFQEV
jgi:TPP-dependent pyruvate/acetoin dehydrogenase alpha subunit